MASHPFAAGASPKTSPPPSPCWPAANCLSPPANASTSTAASTFADFKRLPRERAVTSTAAKRGQHRDACSGLLIQLLYPPHMPPAFERRRQPRIHNRNRLLRTDQSFADRNHVRIVVHPPQPGRFLVEAIRAADAFHPVGRHRLSVPRAAQHNPPLALPPRHRLCRRTDEVWIIDRILRIRPKILHLMTQIVQVLAEERLVLKPRMVRSHGNSHWNDLSQPATLSAAPLSPFPRHREVAQHLRIGLPSIPKNPRAATETNQVYRCLISGRSLTHG